MKTKIIITESQYARLENLLLEVNAHSVAVRKVKELLDANYEPIEKFVREGGEYFEKPMIMVKTDNEVITPKSLYEYLKYKFGLGDDFTKQIIKDWMNGSITKNFGLSRNVPLT